MTLSQQIEDAMETAIHHLAGVLRWEILDDAPTHKTLIVSGWNKDATTRQSIARYLVGLRTCAMDAALRIRAKLEDTEDDLTEIWNNVMVVVGEDNTEDTKEKKRKKIYDRNPWLAEGIWHLCLAIAKYHRPEFHPPGAIVALNYAHVIAKDHGLDVATIYQADQLVGLSLVEAKAYKDDVNGAISDSVQYFREVNDGIRHALRIRQTVEIMRASLPESANREISSSFWKRTRAYLPNPHYDASLAVDWTSSRPSLSSLKVDGINIEVLVVPHAISEFDNFFDAIADEMRSFARSLGRV